GGAGRASIDAEVEVNQTRDGERAGGRASRGGGSRWSRLCRWRRSFRRVRLRSLGFRGGLRLAGERAQAEQGAGGYREQGKATSARSSARPAPRVQSRFQSFLARIGTATGKALERADCAGKRDIHVPLSSCARVE